MSKYSTMQGDSNIAKFLPLQLLVVGYLILTVLYIVTVTGLPAEWNLQYIHSALGNHPFLTDILKGFLALSAIAIAWQRSMATEHQIQLQANSNRISQYYDIKKHFSELVEKTFKEKEIQVIDCDLLFNRVFRSPENLDFNASSNFIKDIESILEHSKKGKIHIVTSIFPYIKNKIYLELFGVKISNKNGEIPKPSEAYKLVIKFIEEIYKIVCKTPIDSRSRDSFLDLLIVVKRTNKLAYEDSSSFNPEKIEYSINAPVDPHR